MTLGLITFLLCAIGTWAAMHWYAYVNLAAIGVDRNLLVPALWILALAFPVARALTLRWRNPAMRLLYWTAAVWMGSVFLLSFWFLVSALLRRIAKLAGLPAAYHPAIWILCTAVAVLAMILWGLFKALSGPKEVRYAIDHSARYKAGKTVRILQISDVHLGLTLGVDFLARLVERLNGLQPDLIFITGDLVDPEFPSDAIAAGTLSRLHAKQGVFAVSGNHEFYTGLPRFKSMMAAAGIPILENEILTTDAGLQIIGIHDQSANRFPAPNVTCDLPGALRDLRSDTPSFLLAHQPKELEPAADARVDMIFSGHTHAGQIFPFVAMVRIAFKYMGGKYRLGSDTDLIVNTRNGWWSVR